jgi:radical SAM protein with 4Fe4S-binding SPASM domain
VATIPAATPRLTRDLIRDLQNAGLDQVAFSLDFPNPILHDSVRGVPGAYQRTLEGLGWARQYGIPTQINSCVWAESLPYLSEMATLAERLEIVFWEVFFLVPTGRGTDIPGLTPAQCEEAFAILQAAQAKQKFILKVTEAPHYRRYLQQHHDRERGRVTHVTSTDGSVPLAHRGVNAGNGFLFISHLGEIYPSGFLPVSAGNGRKDSLAQIYRESPLFRALRDPQQLKGRCGRCPFRNLCGGSRSRAYALTGDWLETDPWCAYEPQGGTSTPNDKEYGTVQSMYSSGNSGSLFLRKNSKETRNP